MRYGLAAGVIVAVISVVRVVRPADRTMKAIYALRRAGGNGNAKSDRSVAGKEVA